MKDNIPKCDLQNEIYEDLSAFIDGELSNEQVLKINEHLLECNSCKKAYNELKTAQKAIKNYFERSTEAYKIPEKACKNNILGRVIFFQNTKKLVYSAAVFALILAIAYSSMNWISINIAKQDSIQKIKFVRETKK